MNSKKLALLETRTVAIGEVLVCAITAGVFVLLGKYDTTVLLGCIAGAVLATANFFLMALGTGLAADKAQQQDVKGGQALIHFSYLGRMLGLFLVLVICAKSGLCHPLALVVPLVFVRPILSVGEIFKKKGDHEA